METLMPGMKVSKLCPYRNILAMLFMFMAATVSISAKDIADLDGTLKEAHAGNASSQSNLINYYYNTKKDYPQAIYWSKIIIANPNAKESNKEYGCRILGICSLYGKGVEKSVVSAIKYFKEGVNYKGNESAHYLAVLNERELKDSLEAIQWYKKAAELKNEDSALFLGSLYENGYYEKTDHTKVFYPGVKRDIKESAKYYDIYINEISLGYKLKSLNPKIIYKLGLWYYDGEGNLKRDYSKAAPLLLDAIDSCEKAPEKNRLSDEEKGKAYWLVSVCYRFGRGVEKDELIARRYTKLAAELGNENALMSIEVQKPH